MKVKKLLFGLSLLCVGHIQADSFDDAYKKITSLQDKNLLAQILYYNIYAKQAEQVQAGQSGQAARAAGEEEDNIIRVPEQIAGQLSEAAKAAYQAAAEEVRKVTWQAELAARHARRAELAAGWQSSQAKQAEQAIWQITTQVELAEFIKYYSKVYKDLVQQKGSLAIQFGPDQKKRKQLVDPEQLNSCALYSYNNFPRPLCVKK